MELDGALASHTVQPEALEQRDIDLYRTLSADIAAGVAVVSTRWRNRDYAATVSGYLSVSYDPPTMLVSLFEESRICDAVASSGTWALSLLASRHQGTANWLASPGNPVEGLLNQIPFRRGPATGAAVIAGAPAWFELKTSARHAAATHQLIIGEVLAMGRDAAGADSADPLIHFASSYQRLGR